MFFLIFVDEDTVFHFNDGEVVSVRWVNLKELDNFMNNLIEYANRKMAVLLLKNYLNELD